MPTTVYDVTGSIASDDGGNQNINWRQLIKATALGVASGGQLRLTFQFGSSAAALSPSITSIYVGRASATGANSHDFSGNQVQLLFGGGATISSTGASSLSLSDWVTLGEAYDNTKDYLFAFHTASGTSSHITNIALSNVRGWYNFNSGSDTSAITAFSDDSGGGFGNGISIAKIEIQSVGVAVFAPYYYNMGAR